MNVVVFKFGGTSLKDEVTRKKVINHILSAKNFGYKVVVVVSAMGRFNDPYATDTLLSLVDGGSAQISLREKDLLISCGEIISAIVLANELQKANLPNVVFTGGQAGILTNSEFFDAEIIMVNKKVLLSELKKTDIVIVAGFQGVDCYGNATTLGRGGSDVTAMALGAALDAITVDIFTDVNGIMTADPKITKLAYPLTEISYNEAQNFAHEGAKVIHPKATDIAEKNNITLKIRSTFRKNSGTLVCRKTNQKQQVIGIANIKNLALVKIFFDIEDSSKIITMLAKEKILIDLVEIFPTVLKFVTLESNIFKINKIFADKYKLNITNNCLKLAILKKSQLQAASLANTLAKAQICLLHYYNGAQVAIFLIKQKHLRQAIDIMHEKYLLGDE